MRNLIKLFTLIFLLTISACKNTPKGTDESVNVSEENNVSIRNFENPTAANSSLPRLFQNNNQLYLAWVEKADTLATQYYAVFGNEAWTEPEAIFSGSDWFVNWADFPAIAVNDGNILTNFLQKSDTATYTYDVKLNLFVSSKDTISKGSWKKDFMLHNDGTKSEHGFVSMRPYTGNSFMVTWLDGRETAGKDHGGGQMTLRGALVFEDGSIQYDTLLDERVCDCCNTSTAIGTNDVILVAYRDRDENEVRDISLVRWEEETGWSQPQTIGNDNWKIAGCPVNGPSIDTFDDNVAVVWFSARNEKPKVQITFSENNGKSFGLPIRVDSNDALGRVDVAMISEDSAVVSWMENRDDTTVIQVMKINSNGSTGEPVTISHTSAERASGFPQMEAMGDKIYFAWTDLANDGSLVKTASIRLENL